MTRWIILDTRISTRFPCHLRHRWKWTHVKSLQEILYFEHIFRDSGPARAQHTFRQLCVTEFCCLPIQPWLHMRRKYYVSLAQLWCNCWLTWRCVFVMSHERCAPSSSLYDMHLRWYVYDMAVMKTTFVLLLAYGGTPQFMPIRRPILAFIRLE